MPWGVQFLPMQVGPPSAYARSQYHALAFLVTGQLLLLVVSVLEFMDIFGGIILGFAVFFGYVTYLNNMNVTYCVLWGLFSFVHFLYASIAGSLIMIIDAVTFRFSTMLTHALVCVCSLFAAALSWRIYADFENEMPRADLLGQFLISVGVLHTHGDENAALLSGDPNQMMANMAVKNLGAQLTGQPQQTPNPMGMLGGLFGGPPPNAQAQAQQHAANAQAQGREGWGNAQAQGQAAQAQAQTGLAGLFGAFSPPDTANLQAQGNQQAAQARAQGQAGFGAAQAQGQAGLGAAQAHGQAGMAGAQGWFTNVQQQVNSGEQLGAYRDPFGLAGTPTPTGAPNATRALATGGADIVADPFLTGARPH